jgi:CRP-like cAMP-binding protein
MNFEQLFQCPICNNIPENQRDEFLKGLHYTIRRYRKGDVIAYQGDVVNALYILLEGSVKTEMILESGMVMNIENIIAPNPLAPAFLFAEKNDFPVDVIALEECALMIIPKESVLKQLAACEPFLKSYISFNSNKTNFLSERIKLLSVKTIKGKLAQYILKRSHNLEFVLDKNQTQLAEYFGVTRPSLARSLSEIIEEGIIKLHKKEGKILDVEKFKELTNK